ncbi:transcription initiation factor TFIID subunit 4-like [Odocoileus virginianus]|uniref:Transcription initiation factor TFIID subunit 4-like n=1 Tax=Odocoileus virginianus TaxID=9874 RepID=A0ABM4IPU6_ODOVR
MKGHGSGRRGNNWMRRARNGPGPREGDHRPDYSRAPPAQPAARRCSVTSAALRRVLTPAPVTPTPHSANHGCGGRGCQRGGPCLGAKVIPGPESADAAPRRFLSIKAPKSPYPEPQLPNRKRIRRLQGGDRGGPASSGDVHVPTLIWSLFAASLPPKKKKTSRPGSSRGATAARTPPVPRAPGRAEAALTHREEWARLSRCPQGRPAAPAFVYLLCLPRALAAAAAARPLGSRTGTPSAAGEGALAGSALGPARPRAAPRLGAAKPSPPPPLPLPSPCSRPLPSRPPTSPFPPAQLSLGTSSCRPRTSPRGPGFAALPSAALGSRRRSARSPSAPAPPVRQLLALLLGSSSAHLPPGTDFSTF